MQPSEKSPAMSAFLDRQTQAMFGRPRIESIRSDLCVMCGQPAIQFSNTLSQKEYTISGMCQECQDSVFGKE